MFIFTWNLHWESMIIFKSSSKDAISLFKKVSVEPENTS